MTDSEIANSGGFMAAIPDFGYEATNTYGSAIDVLRKGLGHPRSATDIFDAAVSLAKNTIFTQPVEKAFQLEVMTDEKLDVYYNDLADVILVSNLSSEMKKPEALKSANRLVGALALSPEEKLNFAIFHVLKRDVEMLEKKLGPDMDKWIEQKELLSLRIAAIQTLRILSALQKMHLTFGSRLTLFTSLRVLRLTDEDFGCYEFNGVWYYRLKVK